MTLASLEHGRKREQEVARQLTRWADGAYRFTRRGLGHRGLPDLVAEVLEPGVPGWPFPISVKSDVRHAPGLHGLCAYAQAALASGLPRPLWHRFRLDAWAWWQEIPEAERHAYWLIWRAHGTWWLSAAGGNLIWHAGAWPATLRLAGPDLLVPSWTAPLAHLVVQDFRLAVRTWT